MCSIAGIFKGTKKKVNKMLIAQEHRAPDGNGIYQDKHCSIGMGRLKIIDLKSINLCPRIEDDYVLAFNGEIYNYLELKKKLSKNYFFHTTSDTEVLLNSWKKYNTKVFSHLNGMYAFAVYDKKKKKIFLARDIAGEKPLYYYYDGKDFLFSSEFKSIYSVKKLKKKKNFFYDTFQHCLNETSFENVFQVPAAHYLEFDLLTKKIKLVEYWKFQKRKIYTKDIFEEFEYLLEDSLKLRLRSDVDYGIYISDGLDSNLLNKLGKFKNKFYFDDSHNWKKDFYKKIKKLVKHLDFPVGSLSSYPLWKLASKASKKVKVVISGEGADEIFGGYVRYLIFSNQYYLEKKFPSYKFFFKKNYGEYARVYARITNRNHNKKTEQKSLEYIEKIIQKYFEMFDDPISAVGFADFKIIMPSLLQMGDRMASAFGIENRCPYLDKRLIEFGYSLPPEFKIDNLTQKVLIRRLAIKKGLVNPLRIEKKGLTIKFNQWFKKNDWDRSLYHKMLNDEWNRIY